MKSMPVRRRGNKLERWEIALLVTDALMMAIWRRGKPSALLHHSDRGSQYTSEPFQRRMADNGVLCSMSRSGNVWDNAAMESFFSSLKTERVAGKIYRTRDQARADVFDYIERFYNPQRRHSTIGYLSPMGVREDQRRELNRVSTKPAASQSLSIAESCSPNGLSASRHSLISIRSISGSSAAVGANQPASSISP